MHVEHYHAVRSSTVFSSEAILNGELQPQFINKTRALKNTKPENWRGALLILNGWR
jgi:hypothetical protein